MSAELTVRHLGGDRFAIDVRGHTITVDQPRQDGGEDSGPTPTELLIAGLASCVAHYARRYLDRHGVSAEGLSVSTEYTLAARPNRVAEVELRITPPADLPAERYDALLAVAGHCTVHNTLRQSPTVTVTLDRPAPPASAHAQVG